MHFFFFSQLALKEWHIKYYIKEKSLWQL